MQRFLRWTVPVSYCAHCGVRGVLLLVLTGWLGIACGQPTAGVPTAEGQWIETVDARAQWYERHLAALPDDIVKMRNMVGVWRGGGLLVFSGLRRDTSVSAYVTSGLTNTDMPATLLQQSESVQAQHDGRVRFFTLELKARKPAPVAKGLAGYGYEVLLLHRGSDPDPGSAETSNVPAQWPVWALQWLVTAEIYRDISLRNRVLQHNGLILHGVDLGLEQRLNLLIVPAPEPLVREMQLPGGKAVLLLAIAVSDAEVRWAARNGHEALFARLKAAGGKQSEQPAVASPYAGLVSSLSRADVVEARGVRRRPRAGSDYHD